ncbi:MAG: PHP domain-containing protein [Planctomycetota bacterium]|nr:MAG: PHP domain-containing protein [Planctomycetota bacterium]
MTLSQTAQTVQPTSRGYVSLPVAGNQHQLSEVDRYVDDFDALAALEAGAEQDLAAIEALPHWQATAYESRYLPALRLVGLDAKEKVVLQNTADLHIHTQWSDGDDLDRVLAAAVEQRLDAIAITDHDEIGGALEARRRAHRRRLPLAVIPGVEVSSRDGHIGALFVTRTVPKGLSAAETVERIHQAGGIAVAHHPFAPKLIERLLRVKLGCGDLLNTVPFDAIECTNAVPGFAARYNLAARDAVENQRIRVAVTGSSDAHAAWQVGKGRTYYAGNEGPLSLQRSLQFGLCQGAEGYWRFREKIRYRLHLLKALGKNFLFRRNSIG